MKITTTTLLTIAVLATLPQPALAQSAGAPSTALSIQAPLVAKPALDIEVVSVLERIEGVLNQLLENDGGDTSQPKMSYVLASHATTTTSSGSSIGKDETARASTVTISRAEAEAIRADIVQLKLMLRPLH